MPSLLDIRRRIRSVKNTQQLTKAMKTVRQSCAALRTGSLARVPRANQLRHVLSGLAGRLKTSVILCPVRPEKRILLLIVTADRGLCGGFNSNLLRAGVNFMRQQRDDEFSFTAGGKGRGFSGEETSTSGIYKFLSGWTSLTREYCAAVDKLIRSLRSMRFLRTTNSNPSSSGLSWKLPLGGADIKGTPSGVDYIFEQPQEILNRLLPRYVETEIYRALLVRSSGARCANGSVDPASRNAGDAIESPNRP
jgi:F-type H+-transporting ATPase subunit gamma